MKKLLFIFIFLYLLLIFYGCNKKVLSPLETFIENNNINESEIYPYLQYKRFVFYDFFKLEKIRKENNYTYLETVNYYYTYNIHDPLLINSNLILVNKNHFLNKDYIPNLICIDDYPVKKVKYDMYIKLEVLLSYLQMINDLQLFNLYIYSAYRSYDRQIEIYNNSNNPNYVAIPGSSEHQTGLALDVATLDSGLTIHFKNTHEYDLLKNNCMNYGFIIRYPENMQSLTGYNFEPWHLRYVGRESSIYIMNNNLTLEQFVYKNFEL